MLELSFGAFRVELLKEIIWRGEQQVSLSPLAFAVLRYLLEHAGQVVSPRELLEVVWPGVRGGMTSLNACMRELQVVLADETQPFQFIETMQQGYRFVASVSSSEEMTLLDQIQDETFRETTKSAGEKERPLVRGLEEKRSETQTTEKKEDSFKEPEKEQRLQIWIETKMLESLSLVALIINSDETLSQSPQSKGPKRGLEKLPASLRGHLDRVRPPRVHITYNVKIGDAIEMKELPFVVEVLADLLGKSDTPLPRLRDRKFVDIDRDNFDDIMKGMAPRVAFKVDNKPTNDDSKMAVELWFNSIEDFEPEGMVNQVEPLRKLLDMRRQLTSLLAKMDDNDRLNEKLKSIVRELETKERSSSTRGFHFDLRGLEPGTVKGNTVQCGARANLIFDYGASSSETFATVIAEKLRQLREVNDELGVSIVPRGFTLIDGVWRCTVKFYENKLKSPAEFHLKAAYKPTEDAGVHVFFDTDGCLLYEFDLPLRVVESVADSADASLTHPPLELDLDEIMEAHEQREREARRRTATLFLSVEGSQIHAQFHNHESSDVPSQHTQLSTLDRAKLAAQFDRWKDALTPVADHSIWSVLENPLAPPGTGQTQAFRECLERVLTAGWSLYSAFSQDRDLKPILQAVDKLKDGSKLSIITNCAFLPWEIFYPIPFDRTWELEEKERSFHPQKLWGARLQIECLLSGNPGTWKPPLAVHKQARPFVSINVNPTIDDEFRHNAFQPVQSHHDFCESLRGRVAHEVQETASDIRKMLRSPDHQATLVYLYCHGQGDHPFSEGRRELLELDQNDQIDPNFLSGSAAFSHGPIVFLNSCSSGAFSPLCFSSFLSQFRDKQALGLITTICPIPAAFAAAFGQKLIERYLNGISLGEALLALRRELLAHGNPLGLFYSLQCHMHVTAPTPPVRRSLRHA